MKVLHLTGWPIPDVMAGTEVFVTSLCRALGQRRVHCVIGCLDAQRAGTEEHYQGIGIHRFRAPASAMAAARLPESSPGLRAGAGDGRIP